MEFDLIKNRIQQYKLSSLVHTILETLAIIQKQNDPRQPFWKLLVLLKWTYLYTEDSVIRKNMKPHDMQHLLSLIEKFETEYSRISFKGHKVVTQSFRIIAYQQFDYQDEFYNSIIDRQIILFVQLKTKLDVEEEFEKLTGIGLLKFFNYCYFTYIYFHLEESNKRYIYDGILHQDYFDFFVKTFSKQGLDHFLKLLTITEAAHFKNLHKLENERLQLYETNFFITKPFLFFRNQYRLPHRAIFTQTAKHFVYTYLKAQLPETFPDDFGKRLERYVELGLKENNLSYKKENELKAEFNLSKVVDYMLDENILIECKATELHPRSGVLRLPNILTKELDSSITKAYSQLLSTANVIDKDKEWYGIIITYREMYLGFGTDAWDEFMQEPIEKFNRENNIDIAILPPANLFFITVEYWDYIMQLIKEGRETILEILEKAKELNASSNLTERVFLMEQVLKKHFKIKSLELLYLKEAHKLIDFIPDKGKPNV